jgi:cell division protein FtsL
MQSFYLPKPDQKRFIYRKKRLSQQIKDGYRMLISTVIVLTLVLTFSYIRLQTQNTALGYYLQAIKSDNETLKNENMNLTHQVLQAQSMPNLEGQTYDLRMFAATSDDIAYARPDVDVAVLPFRVE